MKVKLIQCSVGKYNLLSNEKSLSFSMILTDGEDTHKPIEVDGIKAKLYYDGEPDEKYIFDDTYDNLAEIFTKCFEYADKVISTTDYRAQCLLFAKLYEENYDEINSCLLEEQAITYRKQIAVLQSKLERTNAIPYLWEHINYAIDQRIDKINASIGYLEKALLELKEDSDRALENKDRIKKYKDEIKELANNKIKETS